ncbi:Acyl-CoA-binding protein, ACBP [Metarhizium album ARSEF 1941]|uniref:Acyl-CoA-binding protein, ACBP n=1 Tax=Metarhizium album (strain ARSEF 1941) TaxID=1081103 RepID=A0A0B2WXC1_METAS|nr:Acyl-CoA-binding protein, ACBP [Metarhizium album ARSEF 1941]KHN98072.1 Acyl-CoA-binding protein, ACBP [Metarhizium album ARSEF 1941]
MSKSEGPQTGNPAFNTAAREVKLLKSDPPNAEKLLLYALFKIGTGCDIEKEPNPGMFQMEEKVDEGVTVEQAQERYIEVVEKLKKDIGMRDAE